MLSLIIIFQQPSIMFPRRIIPRAGDADSRGGGGGGGGSGRRAGSHGAHAASAGRRHRAAASLSGQRRAHHTAVLASLPLHQRCLFQQSEYTVCAQHYELFCYLIQDKRANVSCYDRSYKVNVEYIDINGQR